MAKQYRYTYSIDMTFIFPDKTKIPVKVINTLTKHFNYSLNFFPIYECDCVVDVKDMTKIRSNQNILYVIVEITKNKFKTGDFGTPEVTEVVLNHAFVPFFTPDSFNGYINSEIESEGASTVNVAATMGARLKFALYSVIGLSANKQILNYVADECDVGTMVKFLIDKSNIENCVIDKPDNEDTYKNLIVTPHNLNMAIKELQIRYGIYANGLTNFYDPPTLYVMKKFSLHHDYAKDKPNKMIFDCYISNPALQAGINPVTEEKDKTLKYLVSCAPEPLNNEIANSEMMGNEVIFSNITLTTNMMNYENGELKDFSYPTTALKSDIVKHEKTGVKSVIDYDEINNPYNFTASLKQANLGTLVFLRRIIGIDLETFKPNSSVTISIKDDEIRNNEYSGIYSVISGSIVYSKQRPDDETMICGIEGLVLSRMDG